MRHRHLTRTVQKLDSAASNASLQRVAEFTHPTGSQRAPEPAPEVAAIVRVLDDAGGDKGVGDLDEDHGPPPNKGVSGELPTLRITLSGRK
jgi:hypothetical protein